jgi:7-cyano-7-deazaguanine reductase
VTGVWIVGCCQLGNSDKKSTWYRCALSNARVGEIPKRLQEELRAATRYNNSQESVHMPEYTAEHARAGVNAKLPDLETWPNQFPGYVITTRFPEYSSVCPKTGLPDYGAIIIQYMPKKDCIELKSLKMYLLAYRNLGIFYENAVNKILRDIVRAIRPEWCVVRGEFTPRGGLTTSVFARWPAIRGQEKRKKR